MVASIIGQLSYKPPVAERCISCLRYRQSIDPYRKAHPGSTIVVLAPHLEEWNAEANYTVNRDTAGVIEEKNRDIAGMIGGKS